MSDRPTFAELAGRVGIKVDEGHRWNQPTQWPTTDTGPGEGLDATARHALGVCLEHWGERLEESECGAAIPDADPRDVELLRRLYRADDALSNHMAMWRWAFAIAAHAWSGDQADSGEFAAQYARAVTQHFGGRHVR